MVKLNSTPVNRALHNPLVAARTNIPLVSSGINKKATTAKMFRAALFFLVALSNIGTAIGTQSILDRYPDLKTLTVGNTFGYRWKATDEWRCPIFRQAHLKTEISVIKAGNCSYKPVTVKANGPALGCCGIQNNTD